MKKLSKLDLTQFSQRPLHVILAEIGVLYTQLEIYAEVIKGDFNKEDKRKARYEVLVVMPQVRALLWSLGLHKDDIDAWVIKNLED